MAHLARIKLPSPIRLAASSRLAKSALLVLSLLVGAPLAAHAQGSPFDTSTPALVASKPSLLALSRKLRVRTPLASMNLPEVRF